MLMQILCNMWYSEENWSSMLTKIVLHGEDQFRKWLRGDYSLIVQHLYSNTWGRNSHKVHHP